MTTAPQIKYQGTVHEMQKQLMTGYYNDLTRIAEGGPGRSAQLLIAGNPVEVLRTSDGRLVVIGQQEPVSYHAPDRESA